jgi:hypothetical protein
VVDTNDVFSPHTAAAAGIDLDRLLWIRCATNIEHAFKATDLLLHGGGFGLVVLDIGDVSGKEARRIISSWWYRFRRTVESTPTAILLMAEESCARSCASLSLEMNSSSEWSGTVGLEKLEGVVHKKNVRSIYNQISHSNSHSHSRVPHANLLQINSITINRRRPMQHGLNEVLFRAVQHQER